MMEGNMSKGLWVKLSVAFFDDERIMAVGADAELLFVRGLAWAKRDGSGRIGAAALVRLGIGLAAPDVAAARLADVGLWQQTDGGWLIAGWEGWQSDHREARSKAGALGNHRRWHRSPVTGCEWCDLDAVANPSQMRSVSDRKTIAEKEIEREKEKTPTSRSRTATGEFDAWWSVWPKKVARGAAQKAYERARRQTDADTLLAAAERVAGEWAGLDNDRRQFVPHPATWLNGQRWLDHADEPARVPVVAVDPDCQMCNGEGIVAVEGVDNTYAPCGCRSLK